MSTRQIPHGRNLPSYFSGDSLTHYHGAAYAVAREAQLGKERWS